MCTCSVYERRLIVKENELFDQWCFDLSFVEAKKNAEKKFYGRGKRYYLIKNVMNRKGHKSEVKHNIRLFKKNAHYW